ncbi:hypothetical protein AgCh_000182 [Apium graveolens]
MLQVAGHNFETELSLSPTNGRPIRGGKQVPRDIFAVFCLGPSPHPGSVDSLGGVLSEVEQEYATPTNYGSMNNSRPVLSNVRRSTSVRRGANEYDVERVSPRLSNYQKTRKSTNIASSDIRLWNFDVLMTLEQCAVEIVLDIIREYATKLEEELSRILKKTLPEPKVSTIQRSYLGSRELVEHGQSMHNAKDYVLTANVSPLVSVDSRDKNADSGRKS